MKVKHVTDLAKTIIDLVEFHELDTVDSKAAEVLADAKLIVANEGLLPENAELADWLETVRQDNINPLAP